MVANKRTLEDPPSSAMKEERKSKEVVQRLLYMNGSYHARRLMMHKFVYKGFVFYSLTSSMRYLLFSSVRTTFLVFVSR